MHTYTNIQIGCMFLKSWTQHCSVSLRPNAGARRHFDARHVPALQANHAQLSIFEWTLPPTHRSHTYYVYYVQRLQWRAPLNWRVRLEFTLMCHKPLHKGLRDWTPGICDIRRAGYFLIRWCSMKHLRSTIPMHRRHQSTVLIIITIFPARSIGELRKFPCKNSLLSCNKIPAEGSAEKFPKKIHSPRAKIFYQRLGFEMAVLGS